MRVSTYIVFAAIAGLATPGAVSAESFSFTTGDNQFTGLGDEQKTQFDMLDISKLSGTLTLVADVPVDAEINPFTFTVGINASRGGHYGYTSMRPFSATLGSMTLSGSIVQPFDVNITTSDTLTFFAGSPLSLDFGDRKLLTISPRATAGLTSNVGAVTGTITATFLLTNGAVRTWSDGDGTWDVGTTAWVEGDRKFAQNDTVSFGNTGTAQVALSGTLMPTAITVNSATNYTFSGTGSISGGTGLLKQGAGSLTVSTANTYTGSTLVQGGSLLVANTVGSATGTGSVIVQSGATLGGGGLISGPIQLSGTIAPAGNSSTPATLTTGNQIWNTTAEYQVAIGDATAGAGIGWDQLLINGTVTQASGFLIVPTGFSGIGGAAGVPANLVPYTLYSWIIARVSSGGFDTNLLTIDTTHFPSLAGGAFSLSTQTNGAGQNLVLNYSCVPEATTLLLGAAGLMPLLLQRTRRRA